MRRIAHIINPVMVGETSDLHAAQPVTFESMRRARDYAKGEVGVELYSAQFPEDTPLVPEWITATPDLDRSVLDAGAFGKQRKLPLIKDILDRLYEASEADYFVYTNVDIALMPHFYTAVAHLIESGHDAMVINRRTIAKTPSDPARLPLMWAQVGEKHPGYDCFVFRRDAYPRYDLGAACIGANWIGKVLLTNVHVHATNFRLFEDLHLTFHLGDDRSWKIPVFSDYDLHNKDVLLEILLKLKEEGKIQGQPLLDRFLTQIVGTQTEPGMVEKIRYFCKGILPRKTLK
jgi:hypothetical protein